MKKEEIDQLITESLSKDEAEFYQNLEEPGLFRSLGEIYMGKFGWIAFAMLIVNIIVVAIAFYCGYKVFTLEGTVEIIQYGMAMFLALMFASMIKLWHWMQMDKNSLLREMKRLEFQVAVLMEKRSK
ncbi:MAG: DUF6768 family protein [Salibacteraceae bacterium]